VDQKINIRTGHGTTSRSSIWPAVQLLSGSVTTNIYQSLSFRTSTTSNIGIFNSMIKKTMRYSRSH